MLHIYPGFISDHRTARAKRARSRAPAAAAPGSSAKTRASHPDSDPESAKTGASQPDSDPLADMPKWLRMGFRLVVMWRAATTTTTTTTRVWTKSGYNASVFVYLMFENVLRILHTSLFTLRDDWKRAWGFLHTPWNLVSSFYIMIILLLLSAFQTKIFLHNDCGHV